MLTIKLTKDELNALWDTAGQMKDEYHDWALSTSEKPTVKGIMADADKMFAAYTSAMEKLHNLIKS